MTMTNAIAAKNQIIRDIEQELDSAQVPERDEGENNRHMPLAERVRWLAAVRFVNGNALRLQKDKADLLRLALRLLVEYDDELWKYVGCPADLNDFAKRALRGEDTVLDEAKRLRQLCFQAAGYINNAADVIAEGIDDDEGENDEARAFAKTLIAAAKGEER